MLKLEPKRKQDEGGGTKRAGFRKSEVYFLGHNNQDGNDDSCNCTCCNSSINAFHGWTLPSCAQKFQPKTKNLSNDAKQAGVDGIYLDPNLVLFLFVFEDAKEDSSDK